MLLLGVLVAVLALVAAGCGGDDDAAAPEPAPAPAEPAEPAPAEPAEPAPAEPAEPAEEPAEQTLRIAIGTEPPSLDPGLATDTTSSMVVQNILDPLVTLGDDLSPQPALAESWEISPDGLTVTFNLKQDGLWTNGDPVTAHDFEFSWKRTLSPDLAADYAYQLYGIAGAAEYNGCEENCDALRDEVGVTALDDYTLEVTLTSPQAWIVQQMAHTSFYPVHQATVEEFGDKWTEPENIVTNGAFRLVEWDHDAFMAFEKNEDWREADRVALTRIEGPIIVDGTTAIQAFEAGEVDVLDEQVPVQDIPRLKETPEWQLYPALGTYYYGFNVENIPDVNQRRAMALAIDRQTIVDNVTQAGEIPATGMTPEGMPGFEAINPDSQWLPVTGDIEQAKELMTQVADPVTDVTLIVNDSPGHREIAVAIQDMWKELGISVELKVQEWAQFLEFLGPPPDASVDVFRLGWIGDYVDAFNFLELHTCESGNNYTNFCNPEYDALIEEARSTQDDAARYEIYNQLEQILFGTDGELPYAPIYWYTTTNLESTAVQDTYNINLLDQKDWTQVVVAN